MTPSSHVTSPTTAADEHPPFLAHHFETPGQQYASGKLGMWIFLLTEILLFGGLFCTYAVYRANHPEIFVDGHVFLDVRLGAVNTAVLIFSSLTMAWGVRCAQLGRNRALIFCLVVTLACACGFLGIKYVEYKEKWDHGLVPSQNKVAHVFSFQGAKQALFGRWIDEPRPPKQFKPNEHHVQEELLHAGAVEVPTRELARRVENLVSFFGIYFCMTGLHAVHVIAGMLAITWILIRSLKGHFSSQYFYPVDFVGLYWHLVDMIWIFLFPLLYLIH